MARTATATQQPTTAYEFAYLDPTNLTIDDNIRLDPRLDKDFVASVKDRGVIVPIVARRDETGQVRVRYGQRRTLAALETSQHAVPVLITDDPQADDIDRILSQWAENEHRAALTGTERVLAVKQLTILGLSPAQIAKRVKAPRKEIDASLTVADSKFGAVLLDSYDFLTLDQAAVVAEFDDDKETVKALVAAAKTGQFEHVAQRVRDTRAEARRREQFTDGLRAAGVRVIDRPSRDEPARQLDQLTDHDGQPLDPAAHATCAGHAAYVGVDYGWIDANGEYVPDVEGDENDGYDEPEGCEWGDYPVAVYVCDDPATHGHTEPKAARDNVADKPKGMSEEQKAERRLVVANNKAWRSAEPVRRKWLTDLATRKTPPKNAAAFIARAIALDAHVFADIDGNTLAAQFLGCDKRPGYGRHDGIAPLVDAANDNRALLIALVQVLAAYEASTSDRTWRNRSEWHRRYFAYLAESGYTLAEVEQLLTAEAESAKKTKK